MEPVNLATLQPRVAARPHQPNRRYASFADTVTPYEVKGAYKIEVDTNGQINIYVSDHDTAGNMLGAALAGRVCVYYDPHLAHIFATE